MSAVWTRSQELRSLRESDWGGMENPNTEEWGWNSLTCDIHSDALGGGRREDRGMPGKVNTCLQAPGRSSIRFSYEGEESPGDDET